jgi:hypothetical protein
MMIPSQSSSRSNSSSSSRFEIARLFLESEAEGDSDSDDGPSDTHHSSAEHSLEEEQEENVQSRYSDFSTNRRRNERILHSLWPSSHGHPKEEEEDDDAYSTSSSTARPVFAARLVDLTCVDQSINLMDVEAATYSYTPGQTSTSRSTSSWHGQTRTQHASHDQRTTRLFYAMAGILFMAVTFLLSWAHMHNNNNIIHTQQHSMSMGMDRDPHNHTQDLQESTLPPSPAMPLQQILVPPPLSGSLLHRQQLLISALARQPWDARSTQAPKKAMEWMVAWDTNNALLDSNHHASNATLDAIVQRYTMVTLFFATHPQESPNSINYLQGLPVNALDRWMTLAHVCDWHGIECAQGKEEDHDNDHASTDYRPIIRIDLSSSDLQGALPLELTWLLHHEELLTLDLSHNQLEGRLPPLNMTGRPLSCQLEFLYLQNNSLTGTLPDDFLGNLCQRLYHLDLSDNTFSGSIPSSVQYLTHLQRLNLHNNNLTGSLPLDLFQLSHRLCKLRCRCCYCRRSSRPTE